MIRLAQRYDLKNIIAMRWDLYLCFYFSSFALGFGVNHGFLLFFLYPAKFLGDEPTIKDGFVLP